MRQDVVKASCRATMHAVSHKNEKRQILLQNGYYHSNILTIGRRAKRAPNFSSMQYVSRKTLRKEIEFLDLFPNVCKSISGGNVKSWGWAGARDHAGTAYYPLVDALVP